VIYILKIVVNINRKAIKCILLWRVEYISLNKIVEIMSALALRACWAMVVDGVTYIILYRIEGCVLHDMIYDWQLVNLAMLRVFDILRYIP
jgi:hypothetical protein